MPTASADSVDSSPTRRQVLKQTGTSIVVVTGLAGCSGGDGNGNGGENVTDQGQSQVELVFWHTESEQARVDTINEITQQYVDDTDGVSIDTQAVDETQINEEVLAGAAAGQLPNLIIPNVQMIQQLGGEELLSTNAVGEVMDDIGRDRFLNGPAKLLSAGDEGHFAVPHSAYINTFWYSQSAFEDQGLSEPSTWDAIRESAQAFHDSENNQYGIGTGTATDVYARQCFVPLAFSNGGRALNTEGEVVFDSPEIVETLELYAELADYNPPGQHGYETTLETYLSGNLYNTMWSTYIMDDILEQGEERVDDTGVVTAIENTQEGVGGFAQGVAILNSDNRGISQEEVNASTEFAKYLYSEEAYIDFLHMAPGGFRPTISGISTLDAYQENEVLGAWGDKLEQIDEAINSDGFGQFGIVDGNAFPSFGRATGELLVAEACSRVIAGDDPETVASEQADAIRNAME